MWKSSFRRFGILLSALLLGTSLSAMATSYQDWWNNTDLSGMGWNVGQQGNNIFVSWYMYDADGNASFLLMFGPLQNGNKLTAPLHRYYGPEPPQYDENFWSGEIVGTATLTFSSPTEGQFSYNYDNGKQGNIPIRRFTFQSVNMTGKYGVALKYSVTNCGSENGNYLEADFFILAHDGSNLMMLTDNDQCVYLGTVTQHGTHFTGSGTYICDVGSEIGTWSSPDIHVAEHALVMEYSQVEGGGCRVTGLAVGLK